MQMLYQVKQTDGMWNSTDPTTWNKYEGSQNDLRGVPDGTLLDANIPNINRDNTRYYPFKVSGRTISIYVYDDSTSAWITLNMNNDNVLTTSKGLKIVTMMTGNKNFSLYVCRNNTDYNLIPNISVNKRVETYISDDITKDNFHRYRQWNHYGSVYSNPFIPIAIFGIYQSSQTNRDMLIFGVELVTKEGGPVLCYHLSYTTPGYQSDPETDDGLLPVIQTYYYDSSEAPTPIQDLNDRVTSLENKMNKLTDQMQDLTNLVLSISERTNKVLSQVSTVFVSR